MSDDKRRRSRYTKEQIEAINKKRESRKQEGKANRGTWHWFLTLHVAGIILGIVSFAFLVSAVIISIWQLLLIILVVGTISLFSQFHYFKKKKLIADNLKLITPLYVSYNFLGVGLVGLFLFLVLNQSLASNEIVQETHRIIGADPKYDINRWGSVVFLLEDDVFENDAYLRALPYKFYFRYQEHPYMEYDFHQGLFGFRIKVDHRLAKPSVKSE